MSHSFGTALQIEQVKVKEYQILVKVLACGICHTDLHACSGDWLLKG
ncbi:alcohol dehydrogenase catalytic domain-containing protein [Pedobacter kyonggii]|nr:alcohol dehydrogenase catalytic domain-containing protein [Pedobacter kyonggii]